MSSCIITTYCILQPNSISLHHPEWAPHTKVRKVGCKFPYSYPPFNCPSSKSLMGVTTLPRVSDHPSLRTGSQVSSLPTVPRQLGQFLPKSYAYCAHGCNHWHNQTEYNHPKTHTLHTPTHTHTHLCTQQHGATNLISRSMACCTCSAPQGLAVKCSASHTVRNLCIFLQWRLLGCKHWLHSTKYTLS